MGTRIENLEYALNMALQIISDLGDMAGSDTTKLIESIREYVSKGE